MARISYSDFIKRKRIIYIGCDIEEMDESFKNKENIKSSFLIYASTYNYYESEIEALITHEFMHLLLSEILGWDDETWDNVDSNHELSRCGL